MKSRGERVRTGLAQKVLEGDESGAHGVASVLSEEDDHLMGDRRPAVTSRVLSDNGRVRFRKWHRVIKDGASF